MHPSFYLKGVRWYSLSKHGSGPGGSFQAADRLPKVYALVRKRAKPFQNHLHPHRKEGACLQTRMARLSRGVRADGNSAHFDLTGALVGLPQPRARLGALVPPFARLARGAQGEVVGSGWKKLTPQDCFLFFSFRGGGKGHMSGNQPVWTHTPDAREAGLGPTVTSMSVQGNRIGSSCVGFRWVTKISNEELGYKCSTPGCLRSLHFGTPFLWLPRHHSHD